MCSVAPLEVRHLAATDRLGELARKRFGRGIAGAISDGASGRANDCAREMGFAETRLRYDEELVQPQLLSIGQGQGGFARERVARTDGE